MNYVEFQQKVRRQGIVDQIPLPIIEDELVQQDVQFANSTAGRVILHDALKAVPNVRSGIKRLPDGLYIFLDKDDVPAIYYQHEPNHFGERVIIKDGKVKKAWIPRGVFALNVNGWSPYYDQLMKTVQEKIGCH